MVTHTTRSLMKPSSDIIIIEMRSNAAPSLLLEKSIYCSSSSSLSTRDISSSDRVGVREKGTRYLVGNMRTRRCVVGLDSLARAPATSSYNILYLPMVVSAPNIIYLEMLLLRRMLERLCLGGQGLCYRCRAQRSGVLERGDLQ